LKTYRNLILWLCFVLLFPSAVFAGTLADTPLSLKGGVPPNVIFALSVEYPTANTAAYQGASNYSANSQYLGYFDSEKCYGYDATNGWFAPTGVATSHVCSSWSGNFLNWVSMTGLDEFRFAMTGGNRVQDTATLTVLERSYQSGQGGTGNFPDKTFTEDGNTTPYPSGAALTIKNQGNGSKMVVYPSGSDVANCSGPTLNGTTFGCATIALKSDGSSGTCTAWSGNGTSGSPYTCTTFAFANGLTVSSVAPGTTSTATVASTSNTLVTCTSPQIYSGSMDCALTLPNGDTGSCASWTGSGTSSSPYSCATFGVFSGQENFFPGGGANTVSNFVTTVIGAQITETPSNCQVNSGSPVTVTCTLANKDVATCNSFNKGSSPRTCSGFSFSSSSEVYVDSSPGSGTTKIGKTSYYNSYSITYTPQTTASVYYVSSYPGSISTTSGYYYTSSYNIGFGSTQSYNVRVKVCDSTIGLERNCKQFGSAWKPTGAIQENGDKMRFGVMSYFQANDIDNAVMRSKLKYVAPQKYSPAGGTIANGNAEWSATNGTLIQNPDSGDAATANSYIGAATNTGVINYINKFGSSSHTYKTYDDIGKLYYESLKYLRGGKQPTTDFYNGATSANSDGFPVIKQWDDPVLYSCQKNYIITMGDSHTWCDKRLPGGTYATDSTGACQAYTDANGNAHLKDTGSLSGDTGVNVTTVTNAVGALEGMSNLATTVTGAGSSASYDIGGLAYWAASHNIRPDLVGMQTVQSMVIDVQENQDCAYRSQFWLASKYGNPASYDANGNWLASNNPAMSTILQPTCSSRPAPVVSGNVSWPKNLLNAGNPPAMIASVQGAIATIAAQIGDEAALAQSAGSLDTGTGAYLYRAIYNSGGWTGDVQALSIDTSGTIGATPAWTASSKLPSATARSIFTFNDGLKPDGTTESTTNARTGVAFDPANLTTNLSTGEQAFLNKDEFGTVDGLAVDRVNWLRGDQSKEANSPGTTTPNPNANNGWRSRSSVLGDIINSKPVFVGAPTFLSGAGFSTFAQTNANRKPAVYVGGNDGMLHAYDASFTTGTDGNPVVTSTSGAELFAYVPSANYQKLSQLMSPNYSHKYFVDGSPVVGDANFTTGGWKTMLVGGMNAGGQGMYALDVTDPTAFDASKVLWEFTDKDDSDLGFTFSQPIIRKLNNGKWAVIFGSGYNNTYADGSVSTTGRAYLYVLYVDGPGAGQPWKLNTNYFKVALISPNEGTLPLAPPNGLGSIAGVDRDQNGTVDIVYAGDRFGNLWKIDVTDPTNLKSSFGSATAPQPLFTAVTADTPAKAQQITTGVEVARHPNGGFLVVFGTGSWIDQTDAQSPFNTDTFYGIWDKDDGSTTVSSRSSLQQQRIITYIDSSGNTCTAASPNCFPIMSNCQPNYSTTAQTTSATVLCPSDLVAPANTGQQLGWYLDLPGSGERVHSSVPKLSGSVLTFTTLMPSTDPCSGNTVGQEYDVSFLSGGALSQPVFVFTNNSSGLISTTIGGQVVSVPAAGHVIAGGASDNPVTFNIKQPPGISLPSGMPTPPTAACAAGTCPNYVPGWGFIMNLQGPTSRFSKYVWSCHPPQFGNGTPICEAKIKSGQFGRLDWKQINR